MAKKVKRLLRRGKVRTLRAIHSRGSMRVRLPGRRRPLRLPWNLIILGVATWFMFPLLSQLFKNVKMFFKTLFGWFDGNGNVTAEEMTNLKEKSFEAIKRGAAKDGVVPTSQDFADAAQLIKWNNAYRGFVQSMISTNVPRADQIKAVNLMGFAVISSETAGGWFGNLLSLGMSKENWFIYHSNGTKTPLPGGKKDISLQLGAVAAVNLLVNQKRLARLIVAYGEPKLADRQTFGVGWILDNTKGSLVNHIVEFYSTSISDQILPVLKHVVSELG